MSDATPAVFLSYAREDTDAARRIADALRSHGVEVWFDQSELRGGDAWDAKIRKQISDCTLFLPIISQHTQARGKGYFRLEWKLAVEQTHLMAEGLAFLAPVVVDETQEGGALVPPEFLRVQWTRLPGALPTPAFVAQVKRLLENPGKASPALKPMAAGSSAPMTTRKSGIPPWTWAGLTAVIVGIVTAVSVSNRNHRPAPPAPAAVVAAVVAPVVEDKSIAVLPFTNMSEDKDNAFFADGMQEDILTNLALIRQFRVVSRTSVMAYRTTTKSLRQIAQELGVAYILEGSVQRAGNKVRVTGQLIRAVTDEHVWAQAYDRDLTDVFGIQAELSQAIATAMKTALSPEEKVMIARRPTDNTAAYDLYLKGREIRNRAPSSSIDALREEEVLFKKAVELDPNFAPAWGELSRVYALFVFWGLDGSAARLAEADAAIAQAIRIAPDDPDVIGALGTYAYYAYRDYGRATEQYEKLAKLQPNNAVVYSSLGLIERRQGRWPESLAHFHRAVALDPANVSVQRNLLQIFTMCRHWDEARAIHQRLITLMPDPLREQLDAADFEFAATGSMAAVDALLTRLTPAQRETPVARFYRKGWAAYRDDLAEFKRLDLLQPALESESVHQYTDIITSQFLLASGDPATARARLAASYDEMKLRLAREPNNAVVTMGVGQCEAILGNFDEALRLGRKAVDMVPEARDAVDGTVNRYYLAGIHAMKGDKDQALAELAHLIQVPQLSSVAGLRVDPSFANLRGDPRFEALLKDPKNNAPLF